jgi:kynurenine formamidase
MTTNISAFENVANLDRLPATGAFVVALPIKIKEGQWRSVTNRWQDTGR